MKRIVLVWLISLIAVTGCKPVKKPADETAEKTEQKPASIKDDDSLESQLAGLSSDVLGEREKAMTAIKLRGAGVVEPLLDAFQGEDDVARSNMLILLEAVNPNWIEHEKAVATVPFLIKKLLDPSGDVRADARRNIISIGEPALDLLIEAMRGRDVHLADSIAPIMMEIDIYWIRTDRGRRSIPEFIKALKSEDPGVLQNATNTLIRMGRDAFDHLMVELIDDDMGHRRRIRWILSSSDEEWTKDDSAISAVPGFIEVLQSESKDKRLAAVEALADIRDDRSVEALIDALSDDFYYAKSRAKRALIDITDENFGTDKELWRAWWREYSKTLKELEKEADDASIKGK